MIDVLLKRTEGGRLVSCEASGHAQYAGKGFDIVCSAVTVLLRTVLQTLEKTSGIELETDASKRGYLSFKVKTSVLDSCGEERLKFAGEMLENGLGAVSGEYPENLKVTYITI